MNRNENADATHATPTPARLPRLSVDYLAREYGGVLTHGGPGGVYAIGHRLARRLARATGNDIEDVLVAVAERYGDLRNA